MSGLKNINVSNKLVPENYLSLAQQAQNSKEIDKRELLEKRKLPHEKWSDEQIEELLYCLSSLDSNNFKHTNGLGEREGRIICSLVARRNYNFGHGIGRSGDILEAQPKAVGSTILNNLTNALLLDLIRFMGLRSCKECFLVPMATGMTLTLCFMALRQQNPKANIVIWSRIDQKSCFKSITASGLIPIIIEPIKENDQLHTNLVECSEQLQKYKGNVLCIFSTSSCFAPRNADSLLKLSKLAKSHGVPHVVNNAYGLQSHALMERLEIAAQSDGITLVVQSTDKNLMVPVGGAIVAGFDVEMVRNVAKVYPGRASSQQSLDVLMTLLSLGKNGYLNYVRQRKECFEYLHAELQTFALAENLSIIRCKDNPISLALVLGDMPTELANKMGSMLFTRGVFGARVITSGVSKTIDGYKLQNWCAHTSSTTVPYLTVAAAVGVEKQEVTNFITKLKKCWQEIKKSIDD